MRYGILRSKVHPIGNAQSVTLLAWVYRYPDMMDGWTYLCIDSCMSAHLFEYWEDANDVLEQLEDREPDYRFQIVEIPG